uniref:Uncharacterized protein n=1 Tax=Rhizophora mucronata TaxID=61149 RepID=A0A2P2Q2E9_RHIMU
MKDRWTKQKFGLHLKIHS